MSFDMKVMKTMDRKGFNDIRRAYQKRHRAFPKNLTPIPKEEWPITTNALIADEAWCSREFLVQIFRPQGQPIRLSICRSILAADGSWKDGITWDEMQKVKSDVGFGDSWAVEVFPSDDQVINVANFRHLWIVPRPEFAWMKGGSQ
jgi:hypothetical protein